MRVLLLSLVSSACLAAGANIAAGEIRLTDNMLDRITANPIDDRPNAIDDRFEEGFLLNDGPFAGWLASSVRGGAEPDLTPRPATASVTTPRPATASVTTPRPATASTTTPRPATASITTTPRPDAGGSFAAAPPPVVGGGGSPRVVIDTRTSFAPGFGGTASTRIEAFSQGPAMLRTPSSSAAVIVFN